MFDGKSIRLFSTQLRGTLFSENKNTVLKMNLNFSLALSKIMARPRPWKKRHRHFDIETSQFDEGPASNAAQGSWPIRPYPIYMR